MSTDPHVEKPDEQDGTGPLEDDKRENEEPAERDTNSRFQNFVDEAGRRFREALERLA